MRLPAFTFATITVLSLTPQVGLAQAMDHSQHGAGMGGLEAQAPAEVGQSAFAAIQEIVVRLMADSGTDWAKVDIDGLREHLVDMDLVTLRAHTKTEEMPNGARFRVRSDEVRVVAAIQRMIPAHAAVMQGVSDWRFGAELLEGGAVLTVTGEESDILRIRGLGFFGVLALGMHHPSHHLAMASGQDPHHH